jgi:MoxR-like ATPase
MAKKSKVSLVVEIVKNGNHMSGVEVISKEPVTDKIPYGAKKTAYSKGLYLAKTTSKAGNTFWRRTKDIPTDYSNPFDSAPNGDKENEDTGYRVYTDDEIRIAIANSYSKKPDTLVLSELNWRLASRALLRGENIIFVGYSGGGKTLTATTIAKAYNRPVWKFNLGAFQDARTSLIGATHYNPEKGTFFAQSEFITAIQIPGAVIILDEITRMSNDAENILMTVLDADQRYIRIDESPNTPVVTVAEGVIFFATANMGTEYTSTRIIDRATRDRFTTIVDISVLTEQQEYDLLKLLYPKVNKDLLKGVAKIASYTRDNVMSEEPELSTLISTRSTVEQVALLIDGFKFSEVCEAIVLPLYDQEGGVESERSHMKQVCQGMSHLDKVSTFPTAKKKEEEIDEVGIDEPDNPDDLFDEGRDAFVE